MQPNTKKTALQPNTAKKRSASSGKTAATAPKPAVIDGIMDELGEMYKKINNDDDNLIAAEDPDEVTLDEIIADKSLDDETFIIDYGSEDDVPPPTDDDYLSFYEPAEIIGEVLNADNPYFEDAPTDEYANEPKVAVSPKTGKNYDDKKIPEQTISPEPEEEAYEPVNLLDFEEDDLYEAWREAEPLPVLEMQADEENDIITWEEPPLALENETEWEARQTIQTAKKQKQTAKLTGERCRLCGFRLSTASSICTNCGAPVKPKRVFHTLQEAENTNHNLISCRFCGSMVYKRAHKCPKCNNILLKPVYDEVKIQSAAKIKLQKSSQLQFSFTKFLVLTFLVLAIAAMIVWKALLVAP